MRPSVVHLQVTGEVRTCEQNLVGLGMGKVVRFDITLGNPTGIYHPGDILAGQVSLKAREDIPVHGECADGTEAGFAAGRPALRQASRQASSEPSRRGCDCPSFLGPTGSNLFLSPVTKSRVR